MKQNKGTIQILACLIILAIASSCKYEEGPFISLKSATKRVEGLKSLSEFRKDGIDSLARTRDSIAAYCNTFDGLDFVFQYDVETANGTIYYGDQTQPCEGSWEFRGDKNESLFINLAGLPPDATTWTIIRLTQKDLWLEFQNSDHFWELRFESE